MAETHFRRECGDFFKDKAGIGEVNIDEYARSFKNTKAIDEIRREINERSGDDSIESLIRVAYLATLLQQELRRAAFPYLYTSAYGVAGFGSARTKKGDPDWNDCFEMSAQLTDKRRIRIVNGGGTGHMDAFTQGVHEGRRRRKARGKELCGATNVGMTIGLPFEEFPSEFLDRQSHHSTFGTRVPEMLDHVQAVIAGVGGMGTDFEISWAAQLAQVKHLNDGFRILAHRATWHPIHDKKMHTFFEDRKNKGLAPLISKEKAEDDTLIVTFYDTVDEAVRILLDDHRRWQAEVFDKLDPSSQNKLSAWIYTRADLAKRLHEEAAK